MPRVFLALGSNLGDRMAYLRQAVRHLQEASCIEELRCSPVYESEAHTLEEKEKAPAFLNAVVEVETSCSPEDLWQLCRAIEEALGRKRGHPWAPRTLDIDILLYEDRVYRTTELCIPHPRMLERRFVLEPLVELSPEAFIPLDGGLRAREALRRCPDTHAIIRTHKKLCS